MLKSAQTVEDIAPHIIRRSAAANDAEILADVYRTDVNIAIWQREVCPALKQSVQDFILEHEHFERNQTISVDAIDQKINQVIGSSSYPKLANDLALIVDMFCYLFELTKAGLRLAILERAMCPRFHVDNVPCRLVTTYYGAATQWLPHHTVDRSKLGTGNGGLDDAESGLYSKPSDIEQINVFDVALLKGEKWEGNEGAGLVHKSPSASADCKRLFLSLDFSI